MIAQTLLPRQPSYLRAFLTHPNNRMAVLAAGVAAVFASIPLGWQGAALVGIMALGFEVLATLVVPSLPSFKAWADRDQRYQARSMRQSQLIAELTQYGDSQALTAYQQMWSRVQALYLTAQDRSTTLTPSDVEKLEDLTVDYLSLSVVLKSLAQRKDTISDGVAAKRIAALQAQLAQPGLPDSEARQLRTALAEYSDAIQRSRRLAVRRSALEATLTAMPDKFEEVYQRVMTAPCSTEMGNMLEESLSRLSMAEDVEAEFETLSAGDRPTARATVYE